MKNIKLNYYQINKLIEQHTLILNNNNILQFCDGELILNVNGDIFDIIDMNIKLQYRNIENKFIIDDIKEIVCQHLNLNPAEVIYYSRSQGSFDFLVRFDAKNQWKIVVCDYPTALNNTAQITDNAQINNDIIGLYRRLGNSAYYFRWFNDI